MWLPNKSKARKGVEKFEREIWENLYEDEKSLDGRLVRITETLKLNSTPLLRTQEEKIAYLVELEDKYYNRMYGLAHGLIEEDIDWSQL